MKRKLHTITIALFALITGSLQKTFAQEQERRIPLTGFNQDVIADSVLNAVPDTLTTSALDYPADSGTVFYQQGYSNNGVAYANGLPDSGSFISSAGHGFQLAPFNANNDLRLDTLQSGTLTFNTPYQTVYDSLFVLISGASGGPQVSYTINFSDATTSTGEIFADDWFCVNCTPYALRNLGRVDRFTGALDGSNQFAIREYGIYLTGTDATKPIVSISFTNVTGAASAANIFGITGYTAAPLPVSLQYFNAKVQNGVAYLEWKTSQELSNKQYIIERALSTSGNTFTQIGTVAAVASANGSIYHFTNSPQLSGTYLYRLSQVDMDGKTMVLGIRSITLNSTAKWQIQDLGTQWKLISGEAFLYRIIDMNGHLIKEDTGNGTATISKPSVHGIYMIQVIINGVASSKKVIY